MTLRISGTAKAEKSGAIASLSDLLRELRCGSLPPLPLPPNRRQFHGTGKREEQRAPTICHPPFGNPSVLYLQYLPSTLFALRSTTTYYTYTTTTLLSLEYLGLGPVLGPLSTYQRSLRLTNTVGTIDSPRELLT